MSALPVTPLGPIIRDYERRLKDKSYRRHPVGAECAKFLRALRWDDASKNTLLSYEQVLSRLAVDHDDFAGLADFCNPVGTEYLRDFLERHWGMSAPATKLQRLAVLRSLFRWAVNEGLCPYDPSRSIRGPRRRGGGAREAHPQSTVLRLLDQPTLRDVCALGLLARMGLRKNDLRMLQLRDIDLSRNMLRLLHGKGRRQALLPIEFTELREDLYLHVQARSAEARERGEPHGTEYLLYPKQDRYRPMDNSSVHRWFKRCLDQAGLPDFPMHELRHTAGDDLWRRTRDIVAAQRLLRHTSVGTTQAYLHPSDDDLRVSMRAADESWRRDADGK